MKSNKEYENEELSDTVSDTETESEPEPESEQEQEPEQQLNDIKSTHKKVI